MREIKFRGKNENGWHYGLLTFMFKSYAISHVEDENTVDLIDEETIGQYTGLKDKNGVEIYEGDIVSIQVHDRLDWNTVTGEVVFLEGGWTVEDVGSFAIELWSEINEIEVAGNIYENPELLKQEG